MPATKLLVGVIRRDGDRCISSCTALDVASQGASIEEARGNLIEAVEMFFENAVSSEVGVRLRGEVYVTSIEVKIA